MRRTAFARIAGARAGEHLDAMVRMPLGYGSRDSLASAGYRAACACLYAGMATKAAAAHAVAMEAAAGSPGFIRLAERVRLLRAASTAGAAGDTGSGAGVDGHGAASTAGAFAAVRLVRGAVPLPRRLLDEGVRRGTGVHGLRFRPEDLVGGFEELLAMTAAIASSGSLLALYALYQGRAAGLAREFLIVASGRPSRQPEGRPLDPLKGFPVATLPVDIVAPGAPHPLTARGYALVEELPEAPAAHRAAAPRTAPTPPPGSRKRARVRFPIGLKLVLVVSSLLVASLAAMNALASTFFLEDATQRVEENNHTVSQIAAVKVEDDTRSVADRARLALDLSGGDPDGEAVTRFFAANADILYVAVPGLAALPNRRALEAAGLSEDVVAAAAVDPGTGGVSVFNVAPALGIPSIGVAVPYREGGFSGSLVALASAERYAEALKPRGIVSAWVVNAEGRLILHPDSSLLAAGVDYSASPIVAALRASPVGNGQTRYRDLDGREYLGSFRRLEFGDLGVVAAAPADKAFEAVGTIQRRNLYIMGAVLSIAVVLAYFFSRTLTGPVGVLMGAALQIEAGRFELDMKATTRDELGALTETFAEMGRGLAEREKIKDAFGKFVDKTIADMALKGEIRLGGERRAATIFFSDIREFTSISESLQPEEVVEFLNQYLTRMVGCVNATGGRVDKFIGDAIMAVWGVPVSTGRDTVAAVEAAMAMRSSLREFNRGRGGPGKPLIRIGCGINAGPVLAGQIGSTERMEYTVIGDAVNLASRIEALNKPFHTDVLVSEYARSRLGDAYVLEPMPMIAVKGKAEPLRVYAVLRAASDSSGPRDMRDLRALLGYQEVPLDPDRVVDDEEKKYEILRDSVVPTPRGRSGT